MKKKKTKTSINALEKEKLRLKKIILEENAITAEEIFKSLGSIYSNILSPEQKIQVAYLLQNIKCPLKELYDYIYSTNQCEKYPLFIGFCEYYLNYKYGHNIKKNEPLWLKPFDIRKKFYEKNGTVINCYLLDKNNNSIKITEIEVYEVITIIVRHQIPTTSCIVNEALRRYVLGELNEFIEELISGTYIEKTNAKKSNNGKRRSFSIIYGRIINDERPKK